MNIIVFFSTLLLLIPTFSNSQDKTDEYSLMFKSIGVVPQKKEFYCEDRGIKFFLEGDLEATTFIVNKITSKKTRYWGNQFLIEEGYLALSILDKKYNPAFKPFPSENYAHYNRLFPSNETYFYLDYFSIDRNRDKLKISWIEYISHSKQKRFVC